jgi:hypothetical protein
VFGLVSALILVAALLGITAASAYAVYRMMQGRP